MNYSKWRPQKKRDAGAITFTATGQKLAHTFGFGHEKFINHMKKHPGTENQVFLCQSCAKETDKFMKSYDTCFDYLRKHRVALPLSDDDRLSLGLPQQKTMPKALPLKDGEVPIFFYLFCLVSFSVYI